MNAPQPAIKKNRNPRLSHIHAGVLLISLFLFLILLYPSLHVFLFQMQTHMKRAEQQFRQPTTLPLPALRGEDTLELELVPTLSWEIGLNPDREASVTGPFLPTTLQIRQLPGSEPRSERLALDFVHHASKNNWLLSLPDMFPSMINAQLIDNHTYQIDRRAKLSLQAPQNLRIPPYNRSFQLLIHDVALRDRLEVYANQRLEGLVERSSNAAQRDAFTLKLWSWGTEEISTEVPNWLTFARSVQVEWKKSEEQGPKKPDDFEWELINHTDLHAVEQLTFVAPVSRLEKIRLSCTAPLAKKTNLGSCETFEYPQLLPTEIGLILHLPQGEERINDSPSVVSWVEVHCEKAVARNLSSHN